MLFSLFFKILFGEVQCSKVQHHGECFSCLLAVPTKVTLGLKARISDEISDEIAQAKHVMLVVFFGFRSMQNYL